MKNLKYAVNSGVYGVGIGMIWTAVDLLQSLNGQNIEKAQISFSMFLFWLIASFLIGIFFYLARWIFDNDSWSLRKQIMINFFVCFSAWLLFNLYINSLVISWSLFVNTTISFIIMYAIANGTYLFHLWRDVKQINEKLKQNRE